MAPKKKQAKRKTAKTSQVKLANKKLNKYAKQGKLKKTKTKGLTKLERLEISRKATNQNLLQQQNENQEEQVEQEEESPLTTEDYEFYSASGSRDLSFLSVNGNSRAQKKKKRKHEDQALADYEEVPRKQQIVEKNVKHLLPIKTQDGVVCRTIEDEENGEVMVGEDTEKSNGIDAKKEQEPLPVVHTAELYAQRRKKLAAKKEKIALLSSAILENPEESVKKLRELYWMIEEQDPDVMITVRKYVMLSLLEVFLDILPEYSIRMVTDKEKEQKQKKETKTMRDYEEGLVQVYKLYMQFLEKMISLIKKGPKQQTEKQPKWQNKSKEKLVIPDAAKQSLAEIAVQCMTRVLVNRPNFNYRTNVITTLVPLMNHPNKTIVETVCDGFCQMFKEDKMGNISLEIVRATNKFIKAKGFNVKPRVLEIFMALKIKTVNFEGEKSDKKKLTYKEKMKKLSRSERKKLKQTEQLEKDLEQAAVTDNKNQKIKLHTEIVEAVFLNYFRILKKARHSILLSTVLEGLAKFAHLINIEFFSDLFGVINELIESGDLTYRQTLHCIQTAFSILTGQGVSLNIDPLNFYTHMYKGLFNLYKGSSPNDVPLIATCLDLMLIKRRKQVTQQRVLAFIKRIALMSIHQEPHASLCLMNITRSLIHTFPKSDLLYDVETSGSGLYNPEIEDPEHCNAQNTVLWEWHTLMHHYNPAVRQYARHMVYKAPLTGEGQLSVEILRQTPTEVFSKNNPDVIKNILVKQNVKKSKTGNYKGRVNFLQEDLQEIVEEIGKAESSDLEKLDKGILR